MALQRGFVLLSQQSRALLWKNALLAWRNIRSTLLRLFSPLFFFFLLFSAHKANQSWSSNRPQRSSSSVASRSFESLASLPIPSCDETFRRRSRQNLDGGCYDFVWSGNSSRVIRTIVDRIMASNPGREIPADKVLSFSTEEAANDWLIRGNNGMLSQVAVHFRERNSSFISYGFQFHPDIMRDATRHGNEDLAFKVLLPLQFAAEREMARSLSRVPNLGWQVGISEYPHPEPDEDIHQDDMATVGSFSGDDDHTTLNPFAVAASVDTDTLTPLFLLVISVFGIVGQMSSLVMEKELKLRQAMTIMGLYETAYWLSWVAWDGVVTSLSSLLIVLFGLMFKFNIFLHNSFMIWFLLLFLFQMSMTTFAFAISAFVNKSSSTTAAGFYVFIFGFICLIVTEAASMYDNIKVTSIYRFIWSLFPPNSLGGALFLLMDADGITWDDRSKCGSDSKCLVSINYFYEMLILSFFIWLLLAIYFDNILPNPYGVRKSVFYFLNPKYYIGKEGKKVEGGICTCCLGPVPHQEHNTIADDEDVLEEETNVKEMMQQGRIDPNVAVQIHGLAKMYPGRRQCSGCKCKRTSSYQALRGLWVAFSKDQLFCLLGPNGAGKTTTINCLTGITPVTGGDAIIYGNSIRNSVGMSNIRKMIGVCPQFDVLWDALNGQEHLYLFAMIKGLAPKTFGTVVQDSLAEVRLTDASKMRVSSYSGGMKRRLSVAIALIGDPKLIFLDEPTTGMDPISRRHVWDIIERAKTGRAIVLTTHSMEEADILSDRIGIMAKGRLRCIGTSIRLKSRFGTGFITNVSFSEISDGTHKQEAVKQFFDSRLNVKPKEENKAFLTFVIPNEKEEVLTSFFAELQDREEEFGITDIQLGLTTLEDVFLNIARQAELESALAEGRLVTLTLTTAGMSVQIPVGTRYVGIPETESAEHPRGIMVEVYWEQDDSGALCISGHSREIGIPAGVDLAPGTVIRSRGQPIGQRGLLNGVVIDPNQIPHGVSFS